MSAAHAASATAVPAEQPRLAKPGTPLVIGIVGILLTIAGIFLAGPQRLAFSWLVGCVFWIGLSIGVLLLVMIHHIFDAGWSTIIRRTYEHWLAVFPWLALLFSPLLIVSLTYQPDLLWKWFNTHNPAVAGDVLWDKKSGFLNPTTFLIFTVSFFVIWWWLSYRLRKHSFAQDDDGSIAHTHANRATAAFGLPLTALSLTFAAFYWLMSLEYHWFSTMYGVWFFAGCTRAALAFITILSIYLVRCGVLRGIFTSAHMLNLGNVMLAFTVFWAYVTFSQYFLIWNANVPEETFWYVLREQNLSDGSTNTWWYVGLTLIFGHFLLPFLFFLQHPLKKIPGTMIFICVWILLIQLLDFMYNILPALKLESGDPVPFGFSSWPWTLTSLIGIGGICFWAFLNSYTKTRCIPVRDPRIVESLHLHG